MQRWSNLSLSFFPQKAATDRSAHFCLEHNRTTTFTRIEPRAPEAPATPSTTHRLTWWRMRADLIWKAGTLVPIMEEVLKCLAEVSIRQQQIAEHLATRVGRTEEEINAIRISAAQRVPLPDARAQATRLLPKMTAGDDVEAFLQVFENTARREGWPDDEWARALAPLLTAEAQRAYFSLPLAVAEEYTEVKREILARLGLSPICAAQQFHEWEFKPRVPARAQAAELSRIAQHWLLEGNPTAAQVAERVVVDRLLRALPRAHRQAVGMRNPTTTLELVEAIELADAVHHREAGDRVSPFPRRVVQERRPLEGTPRPVNRPTVPPPRDEPMPSAEPPSPPRAWLAGCIVHQRVPSGAPEADVTVEGKRYRALLDSCSAVTLIQSRLCRPGNNQKTYLPITCVHGDTRQIPARKVTISTPQGTWPVEAGLVKDLPVAVLLGRDWPGFDQLLTAATQPVSHKGNRQKKRRPRGPRRRPVLLASDSGRDGESPSQNTNLFYNVYQQAAGGGTFAKEQREDDRLKHCWAQVRVVDGTNVLPRPHPLPHFVVENGLLYCVAQRRGEEKKLLVVPRSKTETILELAHSHPMAGHLRADNTTQRIRDRFHWPGLDAEVKRFCQACPTCQVTSPRTPPPSPLIPLPIIEVPFERIGMDIVGPLPKSGCGHEHILVIVDYATRYPEAVPLRNATAKSIAQELFLLASRVGLPSEILTDQGTPFMSRLMADLCRLLRVKQLRTTVYHPQTDGLVERFNQTLKQMLRRVTAEDKRDWDLMLPYVLFGIREVPQASTGFTPFELLFGRQPRGLLDVAREAWEQQPAPHRTIIEHVRQMRERIDRVMPLVREHLSKAQQAQQRHYNRAAQPREFQPGDRVMVLVPSSACKFLASWQGPYTVLEKIGPVTYRLRQPGRRQAEQLYHINLLKKWVGTRDQVAALSLTDPVVVDVNPHLSAAQKAELQHLVSQFQDVFSSQPGQTNVVHHDIKTPPGVIIRQRPYRVPEARRQAIEEEIQQMLKLGVIEPSRSPWSSPIVMVPKPDGTLRFCNDFRRLNEVSKFDGYPMPQVDELLDRLGRARYISTLDLTKGYWQVPLTESVKPKTAFSTPSGHWQYRTLPFGLHGAPATFQRMMDIILRPHQAYAAAYLDDVVVHSEAWEEHLDRLRRVLSELRRAGLTANPRKCHLALSEAKYLGFQVGRGLIRPQEKKVEAIHSDRKSTQKVCWTPSAEEAFAQVKTALTSSAVLRAPDFSCPFLLQTDASDTGLGAVLSQIQEGEEHPIIYISRKLSPAERKYAAVEKEALAIKWAVLELRYYLLGRKFTLDQTRATLGGGGECDELPQRNQRRPGNQPRAPARTHRRLIGHSCTSSATAKQRLTDQPTFVWSTIGLPLSPGLNPEHLKHQPPQAPRTGSPYFTLFIFSGTHPPQQLIKLGPVKPEVLLEPDFIQQQFLHKPVVLAMLTPSLNGFMDPDGTAFVFLP
ncbi:Retrovirus-related Pol polyprotein from transposon 17.6 [Labeo rohita]|uniref:Gypsy retrotransposon integrase-like protein 1 n=1 Tax=Labeo rohita TaxID=84645 RepID=A0ABQ8L548_LABRO|nr:Retrovirus-related Pol polyprotein from transposon 17.6 [Labeo rohita]